MGKDAHYRDAAGAGRLDGAGYGRAFGAGADGAGWDGGKGYDSLADWKLRWDYGRRSGPALCAADSFTVTLDITFHLPKWAGDGETPRVLAEARERYTKHLLAHEQRHGEIMLAAVRAVFFGFSSGNRSCFAVMPSVRAFPSIATFFLDISVVSSL